MLNQQNVERCEKELADYLKVLDKVRQTLAQPSHSGGRRLVRRGPARLPARRCTLPCVRAVDRMMALAGAALRKHRTALALCRAAPKPTTAPAECVCLAVRRGC